MNDTPVSLSVSVPYDLKERIRKQAYEERRTPSALVREQLMRIFLPDMVGKHTVDEPTQPAEPTHASQ